jgi:membrane-associated protease RseP (regulator of RpoE activity)
MKRTLLATPILLGLLTGCASVTHAPGESRETPPSNLPARALGSPYVADPGRDAATIAAMRAAPAPANPEVMRGHNGFSDSNRLAAQGFVRIGHAGYDGDEAGARDAATRQAQQVGADRVMLYASADGAPANRWSADYYVHFKLPFGATFRDLRAEERATAGGDGVAIGSVIGGTPASRANLLAGDIVLKFDGQPVGNRGAFQGLLKAHAGRPVTLTILRNGDTLQRVVRLGIIAGASEP